jgi:hypothetical protein
MHASTSCLPHATHTNEGKRRNIKTNTRVVQVESIRLSRTRRTLQGGVELVTASACCVALECD